VNSNAASAAPWRVSTVRHDAAVAQEQGSPTSGRRTDRVRGDPGKRESGRQAGEGDQHLTWLSRDGRRGDWSSHWDRAFDVPHDRHEGVRRGRRGLTLYLRTLAANVHKSGGASTAERRSQARSPPQSRAGSNEANEKARRVVRRALIILLSARDRSAGITERGSCKPTLKPVARGDVLNTIPGRPVRVMAAAIVRVRGHSRNGRFRVARHDGSNYIRSMISSVPLILTISLSERRRTE
jgi:hypothetical protein